VRESAVAASSALVGQNRRLLTALVELARDPNARVRIQVAFALGNFDQKLAGTTLAALAARDRDDAWMRAAVMTSAGRHLGELLSAYVKSQQLTGGGSGRLDMLGPMLNQAVSGKDPAPLEMIKNVIATPSRAGGGFAPWQFSAAATLLEARDRLK